MKKELIALLSSAAVLFSFPLHNGLPAARQAPAPAVTVTCQGEPVQELTVAQQERRQIHARYTGGKDSGSFQWQICSDQDVWVDIQGQTQDSLELSYALTRSVLDDAAGTYVRCSVSDREQQVYSDPVAVNIAYQASDWLSRQDAPAAAADPMPAPRADSEYVTITVNYLDGVSKSQIFSPYTATIQRGTAFTGQKVISPTFLGYAPYYHAADPAGTDPDAAQDPALTLALDYGIVSENVVVNVYYKAIDVAFGARYFFQNIYNDQYTEDVALYKNGSAKTGTIVSDEVLTEGVHAEGFTKLYHYPESVAADGSTVFECYYDRNYYLIKFDMNGGYGVDPIYARYGTPFAANQPIRYGYQFMGWDKLDQNGAGDGVADPLPETIPAENQSYLALWDTVDTTATVVYWLQDADDADNYTYWGSYRTSARSGSMLNGPDFEDYSPIASQLDTYEKRYSVYNADKTAQQHAAVNGDGSSVINVYYDRKEYDLRFYYAMSSETDGETSYYVIGGSTYWFGQKATIAESDRGDELKLIDYYMDSFTSQRGKVDELPRLNAIGAARNYTTGTEHSLVKNVDYTYYYLSFRAKYGSDLSRLWPCNVFESVTRTDKNNTNKWSGNEAFVSAWNGEHHVYYSQKNTNQTIKGNYNQLDYKLLWDYDRYGDSETVAYLCFWENGANVDWSVPELYRYNVYLPLLEGQSTQGLTTKTRNNVTYYLQAVYDTCDDSDVKHQTPPTLNGFTYKEYDSATITDYDTTLYKEAYTVNFYYTRNTYTLKFDNRGEDIAGRDASVPYETPLDGYHFIPPYPSNLEANAYAFGGWYTTPGCYPGSEVGVVTDAEGNFVSSSFAGHTMPAANRILYAKWAPVNHTVRFFRTYDAMLEYENSTDKEAALAELKAAGMYLEERSVPHGSFTGSVQDPPTITEGSMAYSFAGWFYMQNGDKKAYTPLDMPVTEDMNIFADWGSHSPQPYRISYVLDQPEKDADKKALLSALGTPVENEAYTIAGADGEQTYVYLSGGYHLCIAADTTGFGYRGSTRTFTPKAGSPYSQLYNGYNNGYFPTLSSHSITMKYEEDKTHPVHNVFVFTYVHAENLAYTVKYVDKSTGQELLPSVIRTTSDAVVTERFQPIADYLPDSFYKRLVIAVMEDPDDPGTYIGSAENEIIFYYTQNTSSSFYAVHFMLQKPNTAGTDHQIDGSGDYYENDSHIEGIGDTGSTLEITPLSFSGFTYVPDPAYAAVNGTKTAVKAGADGKFPITIDRNGTELYIFYTRDQFDYKVYYLEYGTPITDLSALEQQDITKGVLKDAKLVQGVDYEAAVTEQAPAIAGFSCVSAQSQSIVIRNDSTKNNIIFYYAPLQYTAQYVVWSQGGGSLSRTNETIEGEGTLQGSEAAPNRGYQFEGWYLDPDCTIPADTAGTVTGRSFLPAKEQLAPAPDLNSFYAKFTPLFGTLTISRSNAGDEGEGDQVFVYRVTNTDTGETITVSIAGNGSVTIEQLPYGTYRVEQLDAWSWRYADTEQTAVLSAGEPDGTVQFSEDAVGQQWLSGSSTRAINVRGDGTG